MGDNIVLADLQLWFAGVSVFVEWSNYVLLNGGTVGMRVCTIWRQIIFYLGCVGLREVPKRRNLQYRMSCEACACDASAFLLLSVETTSGFFIRKAHSKTRVGSIQSTRKLCTTTGTWNRALLVLTHGCTSFLRAIRDCSFIPLFWWAFPQNNIETITGL